MELEYFYLRFILNYQEVIDLKKAKKEKQLELKVEREKQRPEHYTGLGWNLYCFGAANAVANTTVKGINNYLVR